MGVIMNPILLTQLKSSWFKKQNELIQKRHPRRYLHFDKPILSLTKDIWKKITNSKNIETHSFFPLLYSPQRNRLYKKDPITKTKYVQQKDRPINYPSHYDSLIYSWYTHQIEYFYEEKIKKANLGENVIAYRKLGKDNLDFALEVINFIRALPECASLALDIKGFYDNLDSAILKRVWKDNFNLNDLPKDHYAVFKSLTRYSYVRARELRKIKKTAKENNIKFVIGSDTLKWFRENSKIKQKKSAGIPQGTPISCALSNLYMFEFDKVVSRKVLELKGLYRRYSDDILIVCPEKNSMKELEAFIKDQITNLKLEIQDAKTERLFFSRNGDTIECRDEENKPRHLQYLGVVFDAKNISLRHKGYARFERKMKNAIVRKIKQSQELKIPLFKRKIYEGYSSLGRQNYIKYAEKASVKLSSNLIKNQINPSKIMKKINKKIVNVKSKL